MHKKKLSMIADGLDPGVFFFFFDAPILLSAVPALFVVDGPTRRAELALRHGVCVHFEGGGASLLVLAVSGSKVVGVNTERRRPMMTYWVLPSESVVLGRRSNVGCHQRVVRGTRCIATSYVFNLIHVSPQGIRRLESRGRAASHPARSRTTKVRFEYIVQLIVLEQ